MSEIINKFNIFNNVSEDVKQNIIKFHIFHDLYENKGIL